MDRQTDIYRALEAGGYQPLTISLVYKVLPQEERKPGQERRQPLCESDFCALTLLVRLLFNIKRFTRGEREDYILYVRGICRQQGRAIGWRNNLLLPTAEEDGFHAAFFAECNFYCNVVVIFRAPCIFSFFVSHFICFRKILFISVKLSVLFLEL